MLNTVMEHEKEEGTNLLRRMIARVSPKLSNRCESLDLRPKQEKMTSEFIKRLNKSKSLSTPTIEIDDSMICNLIDSPFRIIKVSFNIYIFTLKITDGKTIPTRLFINKPINL